MPAANRLLASHLSTRNLFVTGLFLIPAYLLQGSLPVRVIQVLLFAFLADRAGKKIKWLYFVIMVGSITLFNLLTPFGRVLLAIGPLEVTSGALRGGLMKGFTVVGLVFISLFSIRSDLALPGLLGGLIGRVFFYFEKILEGRKRIEPRRLIASIDDILDSIYGATDEEPEIERFTRTDTWGWLFSGLLVTVNWLLLFLPVR
ncbi:MAG: hypothetical protein ACOCW6_11615 [Spirochaetota bacterium]